MCGIIGYVGERQAPDVLLDGLKKLEYRGYDSAGIAVFRQERISIIKTCGKVDALAAMLSSMHFEKACCGIGHTRWATHGEPDSINAHPHRVGRVTLVHNGIIENYRELAERYHPHPLSETDSEIAAAVIDALYDKAPEQAIFQAAKLFRGSFALGILFEDHPDRVYALRRGSPLIVAVAKDGILLASDVPAVLSHTSHYYLPEAGELAILDKAGVRFITENGAEITKDLITADWSEETARKNGFAHFMLKEIFEQPEVIRATLARFNNNGILFHGLVSELPLQGRIHVVACGSAYHAGLMGKYAIERLARIPVTVHIASEFRYDHPILKKEDLVIAVSQSGETADTLAAVRLAREHNVPTLGIVNVRGSSLERLAEYTLHTPAGPEIAVATTKAYLAQVCLLQLLAVAMAEPRLSAREREDALSALAALPEQLSDALTFLEEAKTLAPFFENAEHVFFLGRGQDNYLAMEGSLKLKEISYIHSESYAAGELKHGTISLITENTPVIALMTDRDRLSKTASNLREVKSRGAFIIALTYADVDTADCAHKKISLPSAAPLTAPLIAALKLQLLAYCVALKKGCDIDRPRNLAKSVTVE